MPYVKIDGNFSFFGMPKIKKTVDLELSGCQKRNLTERFESQDFEYLNKTV